MFDLEKLNENLKAGTDRVGRMLGKSTVQELRNNAFKKNIEKKNSTKIEYESRMGMLINSSRPSLNKVHGKSPIKNRWR